MKSITAEELDKKFDDGEDIGDYIIPGSVRSSFRRLKRVNVDLPVTVIEELDRESKRIGITRQALIKVWIYERLQQCEAAAR